MKWIKKKFAHLFMHDDIDEQSVEEIHDEEKEHDPQEKTASKKKAFRFPIISKEEMSGEHAIKNVSKSSTVDEREGIFDQMKSAYTASHASYLRPTTYEVEQPGIRELLANRGRHKKTERIVRSHRVETIETPPANRVTRKTEHVLAKLKEELPIPEQTKKRFTPTKVPSPIYGFSKPSELNELLTKRQLVLEKEQEKTYLHDDRETKEKKQSSFIQFAHEEKKMEEQPLQPTTVSESIIIDEGMEQQTVTEMHIEVEPVVTAPQVMAQTAVEKDEVTEQQPIDGIHHVESEQYISQEILLVEEEHHNDVVNDEPSEQKDNVLVENVQSKRDQSRIPFNVIMLQSDKEKLKAKLLQQTLRLDEQSKKATFPTLDAASISENMTKEIAATITQSTQEIDMEDGVISECVADEQKSVIMVETEESSNIVEINEGNLQKIEKEVVEETVEHKLHDVYINPPSHLLELSEEKVEDTEWMHSQADKLVEALSYFQVTAQIESILQGPAVTQFEITVGQGTKVSKIRNLADDLKLALAAKDIRIQAPIPGKSSIGIEIPNRQSRAVRLSEVVMSEAFIQSESPLEAALGLDLTGKPVTIDLRKMPHGLIAGATGSGKSVCINSLLISLLYKASPQELKLMLIDPKVVELAPFNHIPHLVSPVITDVKAATAALKWAVEEMERRYQLFAEAGVRDLSRFNYVADSKRQFHLKLPYILIVIDELADLMMMAPADVEEAICRIAQKARACGIHLIVATQRPSVDVITGLIKSNIPTRIAFAVSSQIDSRTILDSQGAERLLGKGDMLYLGNGMSASVRIQGTFVTDDEIEAVLDYVRQQGKPDYFFDQEELLKKTEMLEEQDDLFEEVCRFVYEQGGASTSLIQRKYHIGYNRAARLIDMLEQHGFVSEQRGSKARDVYITEADLTSLFG